MKIHYVAPTFAPKNTGFAIAFYNIVKVFADIDKVNSIIVYTPEEDGPFISEKVSYVRLSKVQKTNKFVKLFGKRIGLTATKIFMGDELNKIKLEKDDFILVESIFLSHIAALLMKKYGEDRVVTRVHGALPEVAHWTKEKFRNNMMDLFLKSKLIAVTTYHYVDYLCEHFKMLQTNKRKFVILPNTLPKVKEDDKILKHVDALERLNIIQLGRMDEYGFFQKGFQDTFQALLLLSRKLKKEDLERIHYTVIGNGALQPEFSEQLKKVEHVQIREFQQLENTEVLSEIEKADVVLLPSRYEGMSMFATEALSKGKAFIFTNDGGMRDMIFDGVNGLAVRVFDYEQIAEAIITYLKNPKMIHEYSHNSYEIFNEKFSDIAVKPRAELLVQLMIK